MVSEHDPDEQTLARFFASTPAHDSAVSARLEEWLRHHVDPNGGGLVRPIVVVTSGGTTVPLERNCVRYIDNFSRGTRGAKSAEFFLKAGYAVVFLSRTGSQQAYSDLVAGDGQDVAQAVARMFEPDPTLDSAATTTAGAAGAGATGGGSGGGDGSRVTGGWRVRGAEAPRVAALVGAVQDAERRHALLTLPFTTVFDYLTYFRCIALALAPFGAAALFYLAAAVSDFYIPWAQLAEHKIQSRDGQLTLDLQQVPKMLGVLRRRWAPRAVVVSFKLETDEAILIHKASTSLRVYDMHAVVANMLHTRKDRVLLVMRGEDSRAGAPGGAAGAEGGGTGGQAGGGNGEAAGAGGQEPEDAVRVVDIVREPSEPYIERQLVAEIVRLHRAHGGPAAAAAQ